MIPCAACNGVGIENPEAAILKPPGFRPLCLECNGRGEQSPSAEELEIDRLRANNRHMREALTSIACRASDPFCAHIATDTLKRVTQ